jgi:hypothetical protein
MAPESHPFFDTHSACRKLIRYRGVAPGATTEERSWTRFRFIDRAPRVNQLNRDLKEILESDRAIRVLGFSEEFPLD